MRVRQIVGIGVVVAIIAAIWIIASIVPHEASQHRLERMRSLMVGRRYQVSSPLLLYENGLRSPRVKFEPETVERYLHRLEQSGVSTSLEPALLKIVPSGAMLVITDIKIQKTSLGNYYVAYCNVEAGEVVIKNADMFRLAIDIDFVSDDVDQIDFVAELRRVE